MLRIPPPEDDGFALAVHVGCFASEPCVKGQRDRRDQGTIQRKPRGEAFAKRVLDVVEVFGVLDFSAPLLRRNKRRDCIPHMRPWQSHWKYPASDLCKICGAGGKYAGTALCITLENAILQSLRATSN